MNNQTIVRILNVVAAIGLTIGGATTIPGLGLPPQVLAYGLFIAAIAKAVAGELVQIKGQSDEVQGITPAQVSASAQIHEAAKTVPVAVITPTPSGK